MTAPDLDALEKLADRCSFGDPWYTEENLLGRQNFGQFLPQDRAFIAAANPATVLALIAENAALRGDAERSENHRNDMADKITSQSIEIGALRAANIEAERKLAEARGLLDRLIGFAVHDDDCTTNRFPGSGACSCGLSSALQQSRHLSSAEAERG